MGGASDQVFYFDYDPATQRLTVLMRDGSVRRYGAIDAWTYGGLKRQRPDLREWYIDNVIRPFHRID